MHYKWSFSIAMFVYQRVIREADMFGHLRMIKKKHLSSDVAAGSQHKLSRMNPNRFYPHPSISHLYSHYSLSDKHRPHSPPYGGSKPFFIWLVVSTPLKNMSSSVGITIPNIWKVIKIHGSKPPVIVWLTYLSFATWLATKIFSMGFFNQKNGDFWDDRDRPLRWFTRISMWPNHGVLTISW